MVSPALAGLILEFFYTGTSALAGLFPEVFTQEVPKSVVCLAATAVSTSFFTCFHTNAIFHSCKLLSTSIRSQESNKTAHSSTISIPKFLHSLWVCKPKLEFAGQLLGGESVFSLYFLIHSAVYLLWMATIWPWAKMILMSFWIEADVFIGYLSCFYYCVFLWWDHVKCYESFCVSVQCGICVLSMSATWIHNAVKHLATQYLGEK